MIFYIPWTDQLVIILWHHGPLGVDEKSIILGDDDSFEVGTMTSQKALDFGWKWIGVV